MNQLTRNQFSIIEKSAKSYPEVNGILNVDTRAYIKLKPASLYQWYLFHPYEKTNSKELNDNISCRQHQHAIYATNCSEPDNLNNSPR